MAETADTPTRGAAKDYYERITHLIETTQVSATEAAKTVAGEFSKTEGAVLNSYYRYARKLNGPTGTTPSRGTRGGSKRRSAKTVDGYLADAKLAFEGALKRVSSDVEDAQEAFDRVKATHSRDLAALKARQAKELAATKSKLDDAKTTVKAEKAKLEEKIKLLTA